MEQILDRIESRLARIEDRLVEQSSRVDDRLDSQATRLAQTEAEVAGMKGQVRIVLTVVTTVILSILSAVISHFSGTSIPPTGK